MATSLANRASVTNNQTLSLFRLSFNFLKNFSTSSSPSANNASSTTTSASKKPKRKKKNLFEVACFYPIGELVITWLNLIGKNVSYEITKINLYEVKTFIQLVHSTGIPADSPKKISGVHKRCWKYIPSLTKSLESEPTSPRSTETEITQQADEVQAA